MIPSFLRAGDNIHIVSPSGAIQPGFIDGATKLLSSWGLKVTEGKYARTEYGRFAGTKDERVADLQQALDDPNVKAILCSRGGYGLAQIIDKIDFSSFAKSPKWLIGFSDITILHNAITALGIASMHGIMTKYLTELPEESDQITSFKNLLFGTPSNFSIKPEAENRLGQAEGKLIGGNLSVMMGMRSTPFDLDFNNNILFIEDVGEKPYQIDRMMQSLRLSGVLKQISGLVVGQFSDYDEDPLMMQSVAEIILAAVSEYDYPVCFNFPAGHVDYNLSFVLGEQAELFVETDKVHLNYKF
ncbi:MAG: LD-carboxypeptidase [Paludibacter sp.]|nr:LD-carboxypeptidase [Paludibacter sp.]